MLGLIKLSSWDLKCPEEAAPGYSWNECYSDDVHGVECSSVFLCAGTMSRRKERGVEVSAGIFPMGQHSGGEENTAEEQNVRQLWLNMHTLRDYM